MELIRAYREDKNGLVLASSLGYLFVGSVLFLIPLLIIMATKNSDFVFDQAFMKSNDFMFATFIADAASKIFLIVFFFVYLFKELKEQSQSFVKKIGINLLLIICGIILMIFLGKLMEYIYNLLGIEDNSNNQKILIEAMNSPIRPFMIFLTGISAPFVEEIIFRKLIFDFVEKNLKLSKWWAFAISTFVFAAVHVIGDVESLVFIFQYLVLSAVISLSYILAKKNILVPIGLHFLNNLISIIDIIL